MSVKVLMWVKTDRRRYNSEGSHFQDVIRVCSRSVSALARNRTWSTTFAKSRAIPAHSENILSNPPRNRTWSDSFEDCHAIQHTRESFDWFVHS
ncbi:hypothetical protein RB11439 [Rhodopirellula baltica SH 1]|uniref:Uncharacterized protein n=1 Tax=Rhodopirellula baltica (strain DSM 10527 / NCIMB 13988 / SH1) TaxID=243090 RepID=Q7UEB6_RHOBA|nr:hypothetical protein RB11439 [Rhodopirellula baltica SH 1]